MNLFYKQSRGRHIYSYQNPLRKQLLPYRKFLYITLQHRMWGINYLR